MWTFLKRIFGGSTTNHHTPNVNFPTTSANSQSAIPSNDQQVDADYALALSLSEEHSPPEYVPFQEQEDMEVAMALSLDLASNIAQLEEVEQGEKENMLLAIALSLSFSQSDLSKKEVINQAATYVTNICEFLNLSDATKDTLLGHLPEYAKDCPVTLNGMANINQEELLLAYYNLPAPIQEILKKQLADHQDPTKASGVTALNAFYNFSVLVASQVKKQNALSMKEKLSDVSGNDNDKPSSSTSSTSTTAATTSSTSTTAATTSSTSTTSTSTTAATIGSTSTNSTPVEPSSPSHSPEQLPPLEPVTPPPHDLRAMRLRHYKQYAGSCLDLRDAMPAENSTQSRPLLNQAGAKRKSEKLADEAEAEKNYHYIPNNKKAKK